MRQHIKHDIEKITEATLKLNDALAEGEKLIKADWSLDHTYGGLELKAKTMAVGRAAKLTFMGGSPGCQHVLRLDGKTSNGRSFVLEYLVDTYRDISGDRLPIQSLDMKVKSK
jgi:hypothetical protein